MHVVSASALVRNCGYARKLNRERPRAANVQLAANRGTAFHAYVAQWCATSAVPLVDDLEMQGWLDLLAATWDPPPVGSLSEQTWGLRPDGDYVDVTEPAPHVYVPVGGGELLTAGRADNAWVYGDVLTSVDIKTGKWPAPPAPENLQVNAAGIALAQKLCARSYVPAIYYARDGAWDVGDEVHLGSTAHTSMLDDIRDAATLDETPRLGPWCERCWERKVCATYFSAVADEAERAGIL